MFEVRSFLFCRELGETVDNDELAIAVENVFQFEAALAVVSKNCSKIVFSCQKSILRGGATGWAG